ncbi:MAG: hypothetical protein AABZ53_09410 [Planctomycetota bacterium]
MKPSPSASVTAAPSNQPHAESTAVTHDCICKRAHELFLARNGGPGDAASDWCQAEKELCEACDHAPPESTDPLVIETRTRSAATTIVRK